MIIDSEKMINGLQADMTSRFCEGAFAIAVSMLMQKSVANCLKAPRRIRLYVSPLYGFVADTILNYPETLFVLGLVERGILDKEARICPGLIENGPDARWAVESDDVIIVSDGTTTQMQAEQQVQYKR